MSTNMMHRVETVLVTYTESLPVCKERALGFSSIDFNAFPLDAQDKLQDISYNRCCLHPAGSKTGFISSFQTKTPAMAQETRIHPCDLPLLPPVSLPFPGSSKWKSKIRSTLFPAKHGRENKQNTSHPCPSQ